MSAHKKGFTLIELLVVIAIIAILSIVGVVVFKGVTGKARDAARKADLDAISKAYEVKYTSTGSYQALANTDFAAGIIPKTPEGNDYPCAVGPASNCTVQATDKIAYCVSLGDNQSAPCYANSSTCYCTSSTQGTAFSGGGGISGGGSGSSCDTYGGLTSGLVGYWKMDENSWNGTAGEVKDSSGGGHDGTANGGATTQQGKFIKAGYFDGSNDYVLISGVPSFGTASDFSVGFWFKMESGNSGDIVVGHGNRSGKTLGWRFKITSDTDGKYIGFRFGSDTGATAYYDIIGSSVNDNVWHHVFFTLDRDGYMNGYLDGSFKGQTDLNSYNEVDDSTIKLAFGNNSGESPYFTGYIDDVRIYNRALSGSEVSALYNGGDGCIPQ